MLPVFGIHPGAVGWHVAAMNFVTPEQQPADEESRIAAVSDELAAKGFFAAYQVPALSHDGREMAWEDAVAIKRLIQRLKVNDLAAIYHEQVNDYSWNVPAAIGICHPYDASPLIRRVLPVLFDGNAILSDGHNRSTPPRETELRDGAKLAAIESPLAGCLDLVARSEISVPGNYLLLTGPGDACELTAVRVRCEADELSLEVKLSRVLNWGLELEEPVKDFAQSLLASETASPIRDGRFASPILCVFGEHLAKWLRPITSAFGLAITDVLCQDESRLAVGAARYAAWCLDQNLHGCQPRVQRLRVEHVVPHDLGLLCAGPDGSMYWHRLYRAGECLPKQPQRLRITDEVPARIVFAERRGPIRGSSWLEQRLWRQHELRWYFSVRLDLPEQRRVEQLALRLIQPSGQLDYRWSDLHVEVRTI